MQQTLLGQVTVRSLHQMLEPLMSIVDAEKQGRR